MATTMNMSGGGGVTGTVMIFGASASGIITLNIIWQLLIMHTAGPLCFASLFTQGKRKLVFPQKASHEEF